MTDNSQFSHEVDAARRVLREYDFDVMDLAPIVGGHINRTFEVRTKDERYVLQWLNPIFDAAIHYDIAAITQRLEQMGLQTPKLIQTRGQTLWTTDSDGSVWRLMTYIDGVVFQHATTPHQCLEAGKLAARFHNAVESMRHSFHTRRLGVHDTAKHRATLAQALHDHRAHPAYAQVSALAQEILPALDELPDLSDLPERIAHGDMKLSNIIFSSGDNAQARAFVDLDTLAPMAWPIELGDALRSWCSEGGEDGGAGAFNLAHMEAALRGYAEMGAHLLTEHEQRALVPAVETISLELSCRFAADALNENYFNWDNQRYPAAWAHNTVRSQTQLSVARSIAAQREAANSVVERIFGLPH